MFPPLPTQYGESVVLRVLDRSSVNLNLDNLGLPPHIHEYILDTVHKPNGIFIVTGPTGAGKTTTLYAALREINTIDSKVLTAEDPVEYDIDGIIQIPINEAIGLDFRWCSAPSCDRTRTASWWGGNARHGHGPDRHPGIPDGPPGALPPCIRTTPPGPSRVWWTWAASLPGGRLLEGVLAQRLVRTICPDCRTPYEPPPASLSQLGVSPYELGDKHFYTAEAVTNAPTPATRAGRAFTNSWISTTPCGT